jgi:hypothetical protein
MTSKDYIVPVFLVAALLVSGLSASRAEENCLAAPNARAPQGSHWYYRTDRTSQNKCWHLRQTDEPAIQQKPEQAATSAAAAPPPLPRPAPNELRLRPSSVPNQFDQFKKSIISLPAFKGCARSCITMGTAFIRQSRNMQR